MKILITGGNGKLAKAIYKTNTEHNIILATKEELNIINKKIVLEYIKEKNLDLIIHAAGLTKPMIQHEKKPEPSIETNIIGTCNIAIACSHYKIKMIYISTDYVYPGTKGKYKEKDPVLPFTNYGWSKLGGECAVHMIPNSLIIRLCLCNKPFEHEYAFTDMIKNYIYEDEAAKIILKLLDQTGIINVGGPAKSVYNFVKQDNPNIKRKSTEYFKPIPLNTSMNVNKQGEIINDII